MKKAHLSIIIAAALGVFGLNGCGAGTDSTPGEAEVGSAREALSCYIDGTYYGECGDDPGGDPGGEQICTECEYIPARHNYFIVCSGHPTTFDPCTP